MPDRQWTDTDRELVAAMIDGALPDDSPHTIVTAARIAITVLDALTAAGWRPPGCPCSTGCDDNDPEHWAFWQGYYQREAEVARPKEAGTDG